jgi:hypothetical protein
MIFKANHINILLMVIFLILGIYYFAIVLPQGELGQKDKWAVLQGVELKYRNNVTNDNPILLKNVNQSGYNVLGIPTASRNSPRAWLILNALGSNKNVIILPENQTLVLSCEYVNELTANAELEQEVVTFLLKICSKNP